MPKIEQAQGFQEIKSVPKYRFMITRHADRTPAGDLTPEGMKKANTKGGILKETAEVVKGYASREKTGRTYKTSELISAASETASVTGEPYKTRKVEDIEYGILNPDLGKELKKTTEIIEEATLKELGLSVERDEKGEFKVKLSELPEEEQIKIGPIRQKNQSLGFRYILNNPQATKRMAMGLGHQLLKEFFLAARYDQRRKQAQNDLKKDAVLDTVTHGLFLESLLSEAGVMKNENGQLVSGIKDFESEKFGGYLAPAESVYIDVKDPNDLPELLPVVFEGQNRPGPGEIFIDLKRLEELGDEYNRFKDAK